MLTIAVERLELYGYHGVPDDEQRLGHRYIVDLSAMLDSKAQETDRVEDTVDYGEIVAVATRAFHERQARTLERLASRIARTLLDEFPNISEITVKVGKRLPPIAAIIGLASVSLTLKRS